MMTQCLYSGKFSIIFAPLAGSTYFLVVAKEKSVNASEMVANGTSVISSYPFSYLSFLGFIRIAF